MYVQLSPPFGCDLGSHGQTTFLMILIRCCSVNFVSLIVGILVSLFFFFLGFIYLVVMLLLATYLALVLDRILWFRVLE